MNALEFYCCECWLGYRLTETFLKTAMCPAGNGLQLLLPCFMVQLVLVRELVRPPRPRKVKPQHLGALWARERSLRPLPRNVITRSVPNPIIVGFGLLIGEHCLDQIIIFLCAACSAHWLVD